MIEINYIFRGLSTLQTWIENSSRFQAYPCHETYRVDEKNHIYINLFNKLKEHVKPDIKRIRTFFRKIYRDELEKSVCYTGKGMIHR